MFQSPKGRLQTNRASNFIRGGNGVSIPKGEATNGYEGKELCNAILKGFNPQRGGYKQKILSSNSLSKGTVSIPKGEATNNINKKLKQK